MSQERNQMIKCSVASYIFGSEAMKHEQLLMQPTERQQRRDILESEVEELHARLDEELTINSLLRCATEVPLLSLSRQCLSQQIPFKFRVLLKELLMLEEEIFWLEYKATNLKLSLDQVGCTNGNEAAKHASNKAITNARERSRGGEVVSGSDSDATVCYSDGSMETR